MKGLEVWCLVKKYMNIYHHQSVKENIDVETIEGHPISIIEKELKALEIIKKYPFVIRFILTKQSYMDLAIYMPNTEIPTKEEYELLKEVLK